MSFFRFKFADYALAHCVAKPHSTLQYLCAAMCYYRKDYKVALEYLDAAEKVQGLVSYACRRDRHEVKRVGFVFAGLGYSGVKRTLPVYPGEVPRGESHVRTRAEVV